MDSPKAKISLMNAINKARKTLTVNKDVNIYVDSLMDGHDCSYNLSREKFEEIVSPVLGKFENLCKTSIQKVISLGFNINELHSVEMVGDTLRTPIINEIIKKVFNRELSKTLVPDECIARGCALFAMMNSPYYSLQNFSFHHYNPYTIRLEIPSINQFGQETLTYYNVFLEGENLPSNKTLTFYRNQLPFKNIIQVKLLYDLNNPNLNFLPNKLINAYEIFLPVEKQTNWSLNLTYTLDINCLPSLVKVTIKEGGPLAQNNINQVQNNQKNINNMNNMNNMNPNMYNKNPNMYNKNPNMYNMNPNMNNMNPNIYNVNNMNPNMNPNMYNMNNMNPNMYPNMNPNMYNMNNMNPNYESKYESEYES